MGEPCLQSAVSGDRNKANEDKPSAQTTDVCPPPHIAASSEELTMPHHARHYRSYTRLLQEKAAAERLSDPASVSAKPRRCNESPEGRAGENGNRWRLPCERSKWSLKKQHKDRLLKDRAFRIAEERSRLTTDEDTLSELKTGKYWSKAQRKQHMLLAKEEKQRKALQSQREQQSEDNASTEHRRNFSIAELSPRKLMRNRSKKILDNWVTIQELLTHGTRLPDGRRTYSPLVSVTAV